MSSSLKRWFNDLPWMQQGVLLSALRNCDGVISEGPYKVLTRGIRAACIKSAQTTGSFNARRPNLYILRNCASEYVDNHMDHLPLHFVFHLMHAAEVLGYTHPAENVRETWAFVYKAIVKSMHLNVETKQQFNRRLSDDVSQVAREDVSDDRSYKTKNYGDGTGTVNED